MQHQGSFLQCLHFSADAKLSASAFSSSSPLIQCSSSSSNNGFPGLHSRNVSQQRRFRSEICRRVRLNRSAFTATSSSRTKNWVFEPVGDGDSSHIGEKVPLPNAFELSTDAATVGRVEGKADIVLAIATVSGVHARLEKKDTVLLVTDLDSTNGTYVDNKRLRPGAVTPVRPGSSITFGDEHLAQFKFLVQEGNEQQESG